MDIKEQGSSIVYKNSAEFINMNNLKAVITASIMVTSLTTTAADIYVGGKMGRAWLSDACQPGTSCDREDSSLGAFVGLDFTNWFALETGYDYLGRMTGLGMNNTAVEAITLAPKLKLPLTDNISMYGKVGGAYTKVGAKNDYSYLGSTGIEFNVNSPLSVRLEYQYLSDVDNDLSRMKGSSVTLGAAYHFGKTSPKYQEKSNYVEQNIEQPEPEQLPAVVTNIYPEQKLTSLNFGLNSAEIGEDMHHPITEVILFLNKYPESNVQLFGYTDVTGTEAFNQKMSNLRAQTVANELKKAGIDESRIFYEGRGASNPIASNDNLEGRNKNRRVEIVIPEFEYSEIL